MPALPSFPASWAGIADSSELGALSDALTFLMGKPRAQVRQTVAQSLTSGVFSALTFTTEDFDFTPDGANNQHDTATNPSRFTATYPGRYQCAGAAGISASATGRRITKWQVNGVDVNSSGLALPATAASVAKVPAATIDIFLNIGDYVELLAAQESGGALNTAIGTTDQSFMKITWIAST